MSKRYFLLPAIAILALVGYSSFSQAATTVPVGRPVCRPLTVNLRQGDYGPAVANLHRALSQAGYPVASSRELNDQRFGPSTLAVVNAFQLANRAAILTPAELAAPNGFVGWLTRQELGRQASCSSPLSSISPRRLLSQAAGPYLQGDTDGSGLVDIDDLICVIGAFGYDFPGQCALDLADIYPCTSGGAMGNGIVDVDDITALNEAFAGQSQCINPIRPCQNNQPPQARLTVDPNQIQPGGTATFSAAGSLDPDAKQDLGPVSGLVQYHWNFGDGTSRVTTAKEAAILNHTYPNEGTFTATLTVTDRCGATSPVQTVTIRVAPVTNQAPTVNAGNDQTITLPATATLNGSATDDGLTQALTINWTKTLGPGTVTFANSTSAVTTASFSTAGTYTLRLSAYDGQWTTPDDVVVTVNASGGCTGNCVPVANAGLDDTLLS